MTHPQIASHPFALLLDPEAVFHAVEKSQRLENLQRRICRPLDRPLLPVLAGASDTGLADEAIGDEEFDEGQDAAGDLGEPNT